MTDPLTAACHKNKVVEIAERIIHKYVARRQSITFRREGYTQKSKNWWTKVFI